MKNLMLYLVLLVSVGALAMLFLDIISTKKDKPNAMIIENYSNSNSTFTKPYVGKLNKHFKTKYNIEKSNQSSSYKSWHRNNATDEFTDENYIMSDRTYSKLYSNNRNKRADHSENENLAVINYSNYLNSPSKNYSLKSVETKDQSSELIASNEMTKRSYALSGTDDEDPFDPGGGENPGGTYNDSPVGEGLAILVLLSFFYFIVNLIKRKN